MSLKGALRSPFPRKGDAASVRRQSRQRLRSRSPTTSLRTGDAARGGWIGVFFRGACPRKMISIQFALRVNFQGAAPPGYPRPLGAPAGREHGTYSLLPFLPAGHRLAFLSNLRPPFLFLPAGEKETRRARCKGKRGAGVQTKMDPCFDKMALCYVASMAEVWCKPECPALLFPLPLPRCLWKLCKALQAAGQRQRSATLKQVEFVPNDWVIATLRKNI